MICFLIKGNIQNSFFNFRGENYVSDNDDECVTLI